MSTLEISCQGRVWRAEPHTGCLVGRDPSCTVVVDSPLVSRQHLRIEPTPTGWVAVDLGSSGGTWRDGQRVTRVDIDHPVDLRLGTGADAPMLRLAVAGPQRPGGALRAGEASHDATEVGGLGLAVECAGRTYRLQPGGFYRIGRAEDNEIVSANPTVSRYHGAFRHDGRAWVYEDAGSARGSHLDGRTDRRFLLGGTNALILGDKVAGERVVTAGAGERTLTPTGKVKDLAARRRPVVVAVAAVAALALLAGLFMAFRVLRHDEPDLNRLAKGTVRIDCGGWWGSGTIIDAKKGLILTNAHVAAPQSPGLAVHYHEFDADLQPEPSRITVAVTEGMANDAVARFRAELVAADGYLDLAVIRITRLEDNGPLEPALAALTAIETGSSAEVKPGATVWAVGYPGAAHSMAPSYSKGIISGFRHDDRLRGAIGLMNSDAIINGGNSGGLAADGDGRIIGVTTQTSRGDSTDQGISGFVPIDAARPLLDAAREGKGYTSPWVTPTPSANVPNVKIGAATGSETFSSCDGGSPVGSGATRVGFAISYTGLPQAAHQDMLVYLLRTDGGRTGVIGYAMSGDHYPVKMEGDGCVRVNLSLRQPLTAGKYKLFIGVGPNHKVLFDSDFERS